MIYLDNSATTKPDSSVLDSFVKVNESLWFNPASIHALGDQTNRLLESARGQIAELLKTQTKSVIFTSGGTEGTNFVVRQTAKARKSIGKHILISKVEHPAGIEVGKLMLDEGFEVDWLEVDSTGAIQLEDLKKKIRRTTTVVSIQHVNNEIGTIQPLQECLEIIRSNSRAIVHVDAVQSYGKLPVDFDSLPVDWLTLSGHKFHGIKGSGVVVCSKAIDLEALIVGGGQEFGLRSGTAPVAQAVALAKAMRLAHQDQQVTHDKLSLLQQRLLDFFSHHPLVTVLTPKNAAPHIVTVAVKGVTGEVLVNALEKHEIYVSTSSACSSKKKSTSHVLEAMNVPNELIDGVIRISMGKDTTEQDITTFLKTFDLILRQLERNLQ
ncbi:aminotransferase [Chryseomicrobium excrementi]|uniref:Aminotransferase n=1 Tax=Chryseomicrobium excrementi TaxID=2041346 RepID=A0A2M9F1N3_9BACL|nr:cysteine desulfurase family protein [Chryseomicrobium excrementi]PJK17371.1 aminotransferase [Chryseomicrobium excrementi]